MEQEMKIYESLYQFSDLTEEEYQSILQLALKGYTKNALKYLISRSTIPQLRNIHRPPGEQYAMIMYDNDHCLKLVKKPKWGGYILCCVVWDLMIIDIDSKDIDTIHQNIDRYYPNDLFYISETTRGYHLYLMNRKMNHASTKSIWMRMRLNCDPAHATNSLYTGASIRITRKLTDTTEYASTPSHHYGNISATVDPDCLRLYQIIQNYIKTKGWNSYPDSVPLELLEGKEAEEGDGFDVQHIVTTAPLKIVNKEILPTAPFKERSEYFDELIKTTWSKFIKWRVLRPENLALILLASHESICNNNLYRIYESTHDYCIGVHLQESCVFISYRNLLVVDYDHPSRLQILYSYVRYHPDATFRVYKTNKGYHAFLTSYRIDHHSIQTIDLLQRLGTDPMHLISAYHRGYSVRLNLKSKTDKGYQYLRKIGNAPENQELLTLVDLHISKFNSNNDYKYYKQQEYASKKIYKEWCEN